MPKRFGICYVDNMMIFLLILSSTGPLPQHLEGFAQITNSPNKQQSQAAPTQALTRFICGLREVVKLFIP